MNKEELMNRILLLEPDLTQALLQLISAYELKMIKLEKIENVDKMWKQPSRKINDCEAMCKIDSIINNED